MPDLLLEVLSEEIPARMQTRGAEDLKRLVCEGLVSHGLAFGQAHAFATPRRLAVAIDGLPITRADVNEERRGPRVGAPAQAIGGFLKAAGFTSLAEAERRRSDKGEFWFAVLRKKGGPTADVLPGIVAAAMQALPWPKSMKWGSGSLQWVRPVQSIVLLFDGRKVAGQIAPGGEMAPIPFGDVTRGHRFMSSGEIRVLGFGDYKTKLEAAHVCLDPAARKRTILAGAESLCAAAQVSLKADEALLDEVAGLVEWPVPLLGTIDAEFMDVPPEVLILSMKTHQRYFATTRRDGALANRFVMVANNLAPDGGRTIVEGNERVLRARLSDAKFFWDQDRKTRLQDRLPALERIVFHAGLGSEAERVKRIARIAVDVAAHVPGADRDLVEQAALLCKADLVTGMVGEFPELQGVMGRYYALGEELPMPVADAIGDHYAPAGPSDRCPSAPVSIALALADKLDALISFWSIGEKPTGSRDPYALRRAALGVIRIVTENGLRVPLGHFFAADDLMEFLADRLKVQMREKGVRHDVVDAIFSLGDEDDLVRLLARAQALQAFLESEDGKNLLTGYTRAANIVRAELKKEPRLAATVGSGPDVALLEQDEEKAVASALAEVARGVAPALAREDFTGAMKLLAALRAPIDSFFDKVTVNVVDKPELRLNRLRLLNHIRATMDAVADFSKIEG